MNRIILSAAAILAVNGALGGGSPARAQAQVPSREEVNPTPPPPPATGARARIDRSRFVPGPCPLADSALRTTIREVRFTAPGGAPLPPVLVQLLADIRPSGQQGPVSEVCTLRDEANARLGAARYVATVQVPPQRIDDGVLRLEVVSGHIVEVRVRGDAGPFERVIRDRIAQLKALNPLNEADAERILLLTSDVPGLNVTLGLSPSLGGGAPGDLIGELTVDYRRFSLIANVQNYNSPLLGRETVYARAELYGLLGAGDRTFIAGSTTFDFKKQKIAQLGEAITLDAAGDRLQLVGTIAESRPDLKTIDLRTVTKIGSAEFIHPLRRSVTSNAEAALGFEWSEQRTRIYGTAGSAPINRDRIATLYARINADQRWLRFDGSQQAALAASLELRKGLDIFGATRTGQIGGGYAPTRFEGSATATVVRGQVNGVIGVGPIFELATTLRGQWANRALLNYDEFAIGNLTVGRGYDPGSNSGDRAIGGSHELRINVPLGPKAHGQLYGFFDWVHLWNLDTGSTEASRTLKSAGGGVRLTLLNSIRLDLTYAHPFDPPLLTGINIHRAPDRFLFSLTTQLIPFGARR
ncbi:MAG: ShlB/FhaC/HecB family hemolysin secretion/activation protein [Novosphingobium sp.]|nr:ShlB/FhaC/HecB family hemolysin secretion/activation protein [Novosphingobium sp.]